MKDRFSEQHPFRRESPTLPERQAEQTRTQEHWNTFYETWRFRQWNKN